MATMESHQMPNQFAMNHAANLGGGCDTKSWKNYAAVSAMCFPGFDPTSAANAYSQASALAAATANFMPTPYSSVSTAPPIGSTILSQTNSGFDHKNISSMIQSSVGSASPPDSTNNNLGTLANVACNPSLNPPTLPPTSNPNSNNQQVLAATTSSPTAPNSTVLGGSQMNPLGTSPSSFTNPSSTFGFPAHSTTPNTPKKKAQPVPSHMKDNTYWERRRRNNESARRSREARRQKEDQISVRVVYLEAENLQLKAEVGMLRNEIDKMRFLLYQSSSHH